MRNTQRILVPLIPMTEISAETAHDSCAEVAYYRRRYTKKLDFYIRGALIYYNIGGSHLRQCRRYNRNPDMVTNMPVIAATR